MANPITISLAGNDYQTEAIMAFKGGANRIFVDEQQAIVDLAINKLAGRYLAKYEAGSKQPTFSELIDIAQRDPDLFNIVADLAKHKNAVEKRKS